MMGAEGYRRASWQMIEDICRAVGGRKGVAYQLHVNKSLVAEWATDPENDEEIMSSGKRNPLDRTRELLHMAAVSGKKELALEMMNWLAAELGGVFIADKQLLNLKEIVEQAEAQAKGRKK